MAGRKGIDYINLANVFKPPLGCKFSVRAWVLKFPSELKMSVNKYERNVQKVYLDVLEAQRYKPRDTLFNLTDGIEYKVCNINFEIYDCGANTYTCI